MPVGSVGLVGLKCRVDRLTLPAPEGGDRLAQSRQGDVESYMAPRAWIERELASKCASPVGFIGVYKCIFGARTRCMEYFYFAYLY